MRAFLLRADDVLRGRPWTVRLDRPGHTVVWLAGYVLVCGLFYGAVMGTFSGLGPGRVLQIVYSAVKVPMLLLVTFALTLPPFFVLNTLMGLRDDFAEALRALAATQAAVSIVLVSLAPFTAVWYLSSGHYPTAILFNAWMFAVASLAGNAVLRRAYRPLVARRFRHRRILRTWLFLYAFVGVQMGWILRPFIGDPSLPPQFLRPEAWGNAYVKVAQLVWGLLSR